MLCVDLILAVEPSDTATPESLGESNRSVRGAKRGADGHKRSSVGKEAATVGKLLKKLKLCESDEVQTLHCGQAGGLQRARLCRRSADRSSH